DDVGVVAAADRREGEGLRDALVLHHLAVEPDALDPAAREVGAQPLEGGRVLVDHRDVVAALDQAVRQGRPDAAATHDDEVHGADATPEDPSSARTSASGRSGGLAICRPERRAVPRVARMESGSLLKRVFLGRALRTDRLGDTLLPRRLGMPVFASDALSSVAYAVDEIVLTLALAGGAAVYFYSWEVGAAVALVMLVIVASYRQTVHAYPGGGGDYEVASVNLGPQAGLAVGSALIVDYILT